jgi:hypothetical protein
MARKCKSRLLRTMQRDEDYIYETSESDCRYWFGIINQEIFGGVLKFPDKLDIRWRKKMYAFHLTEWMHDGNIRTTLAMSKKYRSKQFFIEVLAHEMVHHWQVSVGEPVGHGPSFMAWEEKFNSKGITLVKGY